ncbi:MAG: site-specific DNA-methyltransferase [Sodaliphilus sp.]|nr:site-specific DNA-methyltransferase [Sodaliphilus sp.]
MLTGGRAVDFDKLRQLLSSDIVEGNEERYQFTWPDKRKAILAANAPINATLRPCREESVDFDTTQNLYIEGDNLDVLKCLKETYLHKVKMIYIDPPYNTGNDFVYEDDFAQSSADYLANSGQFDEQGNRMVTNTESNGRFHTDWLNMVYPRLKVARDLLSEDGVIFISIDDNEAKNLKNITDEVFGERNFLAQVIWERAYSPINLMKHFSPSHDYILCYAKNIDFAVCHGIGRSDEANGRYSNPDNDPRGVWKASDLSVGPAVQENIYPITTPSGRVVEPPAGRSWSLSRKAFRERLEDNRIWFGPNGDNVPAMKRFLSELRKTGITPMTIWKYTEVDHSQGATQKLAQLFNGKKYFDYPKPVSLIERCLQLYSDKDSLILDFFSGSATTAHAVMQLNAEDGGNRKFIMVQLPELTDEKSEAYKAGYKNICEIGKERIRRAGKKIKSDNPLTTQNLDTGFRVLKLDSTNMKDIYYSPADTDQQNLFDMVDNVKPDRTGEDLLFQVMLELGATLDSKIEETTVGGKTIYNVADNYLVACFDQDVTNEVVISIAKMQPMYAVLRDTSMKDDSTATNFEQIFKTYAPNTTTKIL